MEQDLGGWAGVREVVWEGLAKSGYLGVAGSFGGRVFGPS